MESAAAGVAGRSEGHRSAGDRRSAQPASRDHITAALRARDRAICIVRSLGPLEG